MKHLIHRLIRIGITNSKWKFLVCGGYKGEGMCKYCTCCTERAALHCTVRATLYFTPLCCTVLLWPVLYYMNSTVLHCTCCTALRGTVLYYPVLHRIALVTSCIVHCAPLHLTVLSCLWYAATYSVASQYSLSYYTVLYYSVPYCTIPSCALLHRIAIHCTEP